MYKRNKWFTASLVISLIGEIALINPAYSGPDPSITNPVGQSPVDNSVSTPGINGLLNPNTGTFNVDGLGNGVSGITLSPDVIQSFLEATGVNSSDMITICLSDPCVGGGEGTSMTLKDLAKLMQEDLQKSLDDLAAAEANQEPRRFARRRSTDCAMTAAQLREIVQSKLEASQKFAEQVKKLGPNNSIW
jgi:hypothetical protein